MGKQSPHYDFINKEYLQKVTHPKFTKFAAAKEKEIVARSKDVPFKTSLQLQNKWISYYNNAAKVERPKTQLESQARQTSDVFKRVFIQAKALKEAQAKIIAASIKAIGDQANNSLNLFKGGESFSGATSEQDIAEEDDVEDEEERRLQDNQENDDYIAKLRKIVY